MARVRRRRQPPFLPQLIDSLADLLDMDGPDRRLSGHHRIVGPGLLRTGDTRNQYDQRDGRQPRSYSHAAPSLDDAVDGRALVGAFGGLDPAPCGRGPQSAARRRNPASTLPVAGPARRVSLAAAPRRPPSTRSRRHGPASKSSAMYAARRPSSSSRRGAGGGDDGAGLRVDGEERALGGSVEQTLQHRGSGRCTMRPKTNHAVC